MNLIRDAFYSCATENTRNAYTQRYGKGVLVGIISILMTRYKTDSFKKAVRYLYNAWFTSPTLLYTINSKCIPDSWIPEFKLNFKESIL